MSRSNFGHVQRVGHNKYRIYWDAEPKSDGSRNQQSRTVNGTRADAEAELARVYLNARNFDSRMTYADLWRLKVEPSFTTDELQIRTIEGYVRIWKREMQPRIGSIKVVNTTSELVSRTLAEIESPWVQRSTYALWKKMFNIAKQAGLEKDNPVNRYVKRKPAKKEKHRLLDAAEVLEWMGAIRGIKYESLLLAEAGGGLRHEEACALTHEDIEPIEYRGEVYAQVTINKALVTTRNGRALKETKNGFSERKAIIGWPFAPRLLELCDGSGPLCKGAAYRESEPLKEDHYSSPVAVTNNYRKWCRANEVDYVSPGHLRESYSVMQGEAGSPDSVVCLAMGHSGGDGTTRSKHYQRSTKRGLVLIADTLADLIREECE